MGLYEREKLHQLLELIMCVAIPIRKAPPHVP
jgi:hypothetical protein